MSWLNIELQILLQYGQQQFGQSYAQQHPYAQQPYAQQPYAQQQPYGQSFAQQRSAQGTVPMTAYTEADRKSKAVAGVLGILLGALGIHNFYLGYTSKGVVQLMLTLFTCGALSAVSAIWGLVEGIMILTGSIDTDAKGIPLKD